MSGCASLWSEPSGHERPLVTCTRDPLSHYAVCRETFSERMRPSTLKMAKLHTTLTVLLGPLLFSRIGAFQAISTWHRARSPAKISAKVACRDRQRMMHQMCSFSLRDFTPTAPLKSWRTFFGIQVTLRGLLGLFIPALLIRWANVHLALEDGAMYLFQATGVTSLVLGGCFLRAQDDDRAVVYGEAYFAGWTVILLSAIRENSASGPFVTKMMNWQFCICGLGAATLGFHNAWGNFTSQLLTWVGKFTGNSAVHEGHKTELHSISNLFSVRYFLWFQCMVFSVTALFLPEIFFKVIFFMLSEVPSVPMRLFSRGLALSSFLLGNFVRQGSDEEAVKFGLAYFGFMSVLSTLTCGNFLCPPYAPFDTALAVRSAWVYSKAQVAKRNHEGAC